MIKKALLSATVIGIIAAPVSASALPGERVWNEWSKPHHHIKTRNDEDSGGPGKPEVFQFRRTGGHAKERVRLVWTFGDTATTTPPSTAAATKWKKLAPSHTRLLKSAGKRCGTMITVWPEISVRKHGHWAAAKTFHYRGGAGNYWSSVMPITGC